MKKTEITCDRCGRNLLCSGNSVDYRLALIVEPLGPCGNSVTDMMIYPPIKSDMHFCNLRCLRAWVENSVTPLQIAALKADMERLRAKCGRMRRALRRLNKAHATLWKVVGLQADKIVAARAKEQA